MLDKLCICHNECVADDSTDEVDEHVARWQRFWADTDGFDANVEGAITRMQHIVRTMRADSARAFAGSPFTLEDYQTLHTLLVQPYPVQATPAQLAEALHVTRAAVTSRLDRLADAGLITRDVDTADRRRVIVRPTVAGRAAWDHNVYEGMARERQLFSALDAEDMRQLNAILRKVIRSTGHQPPLP